jgi:hypothetical protein
MLDNICQITMKGATGTFHPLFTNYNTYGYIALGAQHSTSKMALGLV